MSPAERGIISAMPMFFLGFGVENSLLLGKDCLQPLARSGEYYSKVLHIMIIPADGERETAFDVRIRSFQIRIFQRTSRQHSFLRIVESYGEELVPVVDKILLHDNFMDS